VSRNKPTKEHWTGNEARTLIKQWCKLARGVKQKDVQQMGYWHYMTQCNCESNLIYKTPGSVLNLIIRTTWKRHYLSPWSVVTWFSCGTPFCVITKLSSNSISSSVYVLLQEIFCEGPYKMIKLSLFMPWRHIGGRRDIAPLILRHKMEMSGYLTRGKEPRYSWRLGWMDLGGGLGVLEKSLISCPYRCSNFGWPSPQRTETLLQLHMCVLM